MSDYFDDVRRAAEEARHRQGYRNGDGMKRLQFAASILGLIAALFALGYNWRRVDEMVAAQTQFQRKDVAEQQYQNILTQLNDIKLMLGTSR